MVSLRGGADLPSTSCDPEGVVSRAVESRAVPAQREEKTVSPAMAEGGRTEVPRWGGSDGKRTG